MYSSEYVSFPLTTMSLSRKVKYSAASTAITMNDTNAMLAAMRFMARLRRRCRFWRCTYTSCWRCASFSRWRRLASSMLRSVSVSFMLMRAAVPLPVRNMRVRLPRRAGGASSSNSRIGGSSAWLPGSSAGAAGGVSATAAAPSAGASARSPAVPPASTPPSGAP